LLQNYFYQAEDGIRYRNVTGVQTCALPICFVTETLEANSQVEAPTVGFIAHMDTADFNARNVNPQFIEDYDGTDIVLNEELGVRSEERRVGKEYRAQEWAEKK